MILLRAPSTMLSPRNHIHIKLNLFSNNIALTKVITAWIMFTKKIVVTCYKSLQTFCFCIKPRPQFPPNLNQVLPAPINTTIKRFNDAVVSTSGYCIASSDIRVGEKRSRLISPIYSVSTFLQLSLYADRECKSASITFPSKHIFCCNLLIYECFLGDRAAFQIPLTLLQRLNPDTL